jgi:hypothetical protein
MVFRSTSDDSSEARPSIRLVMRVMVLGLTILSGCMGSSGATLVTGRCHKDSVPVEFGELAF